MAHFNFTWSVSLLLAIANPLWQRAGFKREKSGGWKEVVPVEWNPLGLAALVPRRGLPEEWLPQQSHWSFLPQAAAHTLPALTGSCGSVPSPGPQGQFNPVFIIVCCLSFGLLVLWLSKHPLPLVGSGTGREKFISLHSCNNNSCPGRGCMQGWLRALTVLIPSLMTGWHLGSQVGGKGSLSKAEPCLLRSWEDTFLGKVSLGLHSFPERPIPSPSLHWPPRLLLLKGMKGISGWMESLQLNGVSVRAPEMKGPP